MSTEPMIADYPIVAPHPDGPELWAAAVPRACALAEIVRDEDATAVAALTDALDRTELVALAVVLAAMVDVDRPGGATQMLVWTEEPAVVTRPRGRPSRGRSMSPKEMVLARGNRMPPLDLADWTPDAAAVAHHDWEVAGIRNAWTAAGERAWQVHREIETNDRAITHPLEAS